MKTFFLTLILVNCIISNLYASGFADTTSTNIIILTGFEYTKGIIYHGESPFFQSNESFPGSAKYQGDWFSNLKLKYDCKEDLLVLVDNENFRQIELISEKLDEFYLENHHFIKITDKNLSAGFYELIHEGQYRFFVKWQKKAERNQMEEIHYVPYTQMFVYMDDHYNHIRKFKDFLKIMNDSKTKIIKYCRQNHIKYRKDPIHTLQMVLTYLENNKN